MQRNKTHCPSLHLIELAQINRVYLFKYFYGFQERYQQDRRRAISCIERKLSKGNRALVLLLPWGSILYVSPSFSVLPSVLSILFYFYIFFLFSSFTSIFSSLHLSPILLSFSLKSNVHDLQNRQSVLCFKSIFCSPLFSFPISYPTFISPFVILLAYNNSFLTSANVFTYIFLVPVLLLSTSKSNLSRFCRSICFPFHSDIWEQHTMFEIARA